MDYEKCLVELEEVLNHLKEEELRKIPYEIRKVINEKKDKQYNWKYDEDKELEEQDMNRKTILMLSYLNMKYLLNEEQRVLMEELHRFNEEKIEKEKRKKYDSKDIFEKNIYNRDKRINENYSNMQMVIIREEKWYKKVIKKIANIFSRSK